MKKILIVEDDEKSLYLARFILENEGYEVIETRNGLEALDKLSKESPDLILMDMQLPKLDGYEATRRIKADERLAKIPVVALTAYAMKTNQEKSLAAGCSGHIEKPIDPTTFMEEVKKQSHIVICFQRIRNILATFPLLPKTTI
jgi:two-component system cell cycle response regulator DivK